MLTCSAVSILRQTCAEKLVVRCLLSDTIEAVGGHPQMGSAGRNYLWGTCRQERPKRECFARLGDMRRSPAVAAFPVVWTNPMQDVSKIFSAFGSVADVFIPFDHATGQKKGCAFVQVSRGEQDGTSRLPG